MTAKSRRLAVRFNYSLAALFCCALVLVPLLASSPGLTWAARLTGLPGTFVAVWAASHTAALVTCVLPSLGVVICIFGLSLSAAGYHLGEPTIAGAVFSLTLILVVIASALLRGLPILAVALLPLGFALYAARKT